MATELTKHRTIGLTDTEVARVLGEAAVEMYGLGSRLTATGDAVRLAGKVALVTGGGSGIGRAIAVAYQREGARLAVVDRNGPAAEATAAAAGRDAHAVVADVSSAEDVRAMVSATTDAFGRLDVLVNSAAVQLHDRDARCPSCRRRRGRRRSA